MEDASPGRDNSVWLERVPGGLSVGVPRVLLLTKELPQQPAKWLSLPRSLWATPLLREPLRCSRRFSQETRKPPVRSEGLHILPRRCQPAGWPTCLVEKGLFTKSQTTASICCWLNLQAYHRIHAPQWQPAAQPARVRQPTMHGGAGCRVCSVPLLGGSVPFSRVCCP